MKGLEIIKGTHTFSQKSLSAKTQVNHKEVIFNRQTPTKSHLCLAQITMRFKCKVEDSDPFYLRWRKAFSLLKLKLYQVCHVTTRTRSEKRVPRRFCHSMSITECTYTQAGSIASQCLWDHRSTGSPSWSAALWLSIWLSSDENLTFGDSPMVWTKDLI